MYYREVGAAYQFRRLRVEEELYGAWLHYRWTRRWDRSERRRARLEMAADLIRELTGRHEKTLAGICEAVGRYRSMVETATHATPEIALSVELLAFQLRLSARKDEALAGIAGIVAIYRKLAETDPAEFQPYLERAQSDLVNWLQRSGRQQDALRVTKEAVNLYRGPAQTDMAIRPQFAKALSDFADNLGRSGRHDESLQATTEAVEIYRKLAEVDTAAYRAHLARALCGLADRLTN